MQQRHSGGVGGAYGVVTCLFFAWGFITSLNDPLVASVKGIFRLSDVEAQLTAFAFFIAYGVMSLPGAVLLARLKSVPTVLLSLALMVGGCILMMAAVNLSTYPVILLGLFILASGITVLQVAANPLAAALGAPEGSHFRLTFSQAFNSFGTFLGPILGAHLFLRGIEIKLGTTVTETARASALTGIGRAYLWLAVLLLLIGLMIFWARGLIGRSAPPPAKAASGPGVRQTIREAISSRWALLGGLAIFLYVGAEVGIGTQMALFLNSDLVWGHSDTLFDAPLVNLVVPQDGVVGLSLEQAGKATAFYWGGAMIGRFAGSALLTRVPAPRLLAIFTAIACLLCLFVFAVGGAPAGWAALSIGLFNSIMFPVVFTITLERSTASEESTSGFLCFSIVGGAVVPLLVGLVSEHSSYVTAFIVPAACYALLCLFALASGRAPIRRRERLEAAGAH